MFLNQSVVEFAVGGRICFLTYCAYIVYLIFTLYVVALILGLNVSY